MPDYSKPISGLRLRRLRRISSTFCFSERMPASSSCVSKTMAELNFSLADIKLYVMYSCKKLLALALVKSKLCTCDYFELYCAILCSICFKFTKLKLVCTSKLYMSSEEQSMRRDQIGCDSSLASNKYFVKRPCFDCVFRITLESKLYEAQMRRLYTWYGLFRIAISAFTTSLVELRKPSIGCVLL